MQRSETEQPQKEKKKEEKNFPQTFSAILSRGPDPVKPTSCESGFGTVAKSRGRGDGGIIVVL